MAMDPSIYMQMAQMAANTSANMMRDWSGVIDQRQWLMNHFPNFWGSPYQGDNQPQSNAPMINSIAQTMSAARQQNNAEKVSQAGIDESKSRTAFNDWMLQQAKDNAKNNNGGSSSYSHLWE
jgi:hypothetical protein